LQAPGNEFDQPDTIACLPDLFAAVAKAITGAHCNGYHFFGLTPKEETP
jgi:hypothetical protein